MINNYFVDMYLSKCDPQKSVKSISKLFSTFKKLVGAIIVALFLPIGIFILNSILPVITKSNEFIESRLINLLSQDAFLYIALSHLIVRFTLKLCFLFVSVKAIIFLVWFLVCSLVKKENKIGDEFFAVMNFDGVVCYKSKVQFLN